MGEVIAVLSGKGGTGKTTVCAGLATALAQSGARVLCIDCDVGLRNLDISLGVQDICGLSFLDVCRSDYAMSLASVHPAYPKLSFLTAPMNCQPSQIDPLGFGAMLRAAARDYDYVLLDSAAGVDTVFQLTSRFADRCIVVTGPSPAAIRDAARVGELLELAGKQNVRLIVNRVSKKIASTLDLTVDDIMDEAGLPLLGIVPEDFHVVLAAAEGLALLQSKKRCAAAKAFGRIANRIMGLPEPLKIR